MDPQADIAMLRAEVEGLKALVQSLSEAGGAAGKGFGPDVGLPITPIGGADYGAFRWDGEKIANCKFSFGRQVYGLQDVENATADGTWSLVIPHATPAQATVLLNTDQVTGLTQTVVPLFRVSAGAVVEDWRGMPTVPVRE